MKVSAVTITSLAVVFMSACSFTPKEQASGSFDYVAVQAQQAIIPAADLSLPPARDTYAVPPVEGQRDIGAAVNILAPVLVWPTAAGSRVEEADTQVRVHFDEVEGTDDLPSLIWAASLARLQADSIAVQTERVQQLIETGWVTEQKTIGDDELELIIERRFAIEFEAPAHGRTVAVQVNLLEKKESGAGAGLRPGLVDDRNQAALLLNSLINEVAVRLISTQKQISPDTYTVSAGFDGKGYAALLVDTSFINTWTIVGLALPELGFTVDDLNQSSGRYYVTYNSESSVLGSLAFWRDNPSLALTDGAYEILVTGDQTATSITFYRDGQPLPAAEVNALYAPFAAEFRRQLEL
ncbi:outer membrane protein assembly factor BamC [Pseudidiomarina mangrovi]|uniref:outer membrane protein assembly factor BamC n=1 Tax=Pseudidiomarina mangrovi TaxID=2487133 RepID=UPI000FCB8187|nr:outer membrane protein assembly factor BamC [Pseudidiomarina mangrovi]